MKSLVNFQFENCRVLNYHDSIIITAEENFNRCNYRGISSLLSILQTNTLDNPLSLIFLKNDLPLLEMDILTGNSLKQNSFPSNPTLSVKYVTDANWRRIKDHPPWNSNNFKIDLVIYPQIALQNILFTQLYEVQFNLAPAIELSLWRGMQFTGQVIFPIINQIDYQGKFIRPGFITLSQQFRFPHNWYGTIAMGNFNANRYGFDLNIDHPINNHWSVSGNAGLTGSSNFYYGEWVNGELNTLTWFIKAMYFYPKLNLQFDLSYGCYLNKDYGFRADCTRHFGETTVGFYVMYSGGVPNGGFHFALPLPSATRNRRHHFRLMLPRYFDWEYNAATEFYYGRYYETRPNENRSEHWFNPLFIKNQLLKTQEK